MSLHSMPYANAASAVFTLDRQHRYLLTRRWDVGPALTWLMLNPSRADAFRLDPTVTRCVNHSRRAGAGAVRIVNLFSLMATYQWDLWHHPEPVTGRNDSWIQACLGGSVKVVCAWGAAPAGMQAATCFYERVAAIAELLQGQELCCLGQTRSGQPAHPLARRRFTRFMPFELLA